MRTAVDQLLEGGCECPRVSFIISAAEEGDGTYQPFSLHRADVIDGDVVVDVYDKVDEYGDAVFRTLRDRGSHDPSVAIRVPLYRSQFGSRALAMANAGSRSNFG